jgi:hypothetical protein
VGVVRFIVGAGAIASAAYLVVSRTRAASFDYPIGDAWYPPVQWGSGSDTEVDVAQSEQAATLVPMGGIQPEGASVAAPSTQWQGNLDEVGPPDAATGDAEMGQFALQGWAAAPGHAVVSGITFRRRLSRDVSVEEIALEIEATVNVPESGLMILRDGGFAPSREGFALMLAAAGPGAFSASGVYRIAPHGSRGRREGSIPKSD